VNGALLHGHAILFMGCGWIAAWCSLNLEIAGRVKSSQVNTQPQSKEQNPQQAEQGHAQIQQCV